MLDSTFKTYTFLKDFYILSWSFAQGYNEISKSFTEIWKRRASKRMYDYMGERDDYTALIEMEQWEEKVEIYNIICYTLKDNFYKTINY